MHTRGMGGISYEIDSAMDVRPCVNPVCPAANKKNTHHRCKCAENPFIKGKNWVILKEKKEKGIFEPQVKLKPPPPKKKKTNTHNRCHGKLIIIGANFSQTHP